VREAAVGLGLVAVMMVAAVIWDAPLHEQANPGMSPNPAKAPWYFLGFQELLLHLHPVFAICVVPVLVSAFLSILPFRQNAMLPGGIWFGGQRGRRLALWSFGTGILLTTLMVVLDEKLLRTGTNGGDMADMASRGYLPVIGTVLVLVGGYEIGFRRCKYSRAESVMAGMLLGWAVLFTLTVVGIWFRGPGMQLIWP